MRDRLLSRAKVFKTRCQKPIRQRFRECVNTSVTAHGCQQKSYAPAPLRAQSVIAINVHLGF
jgi:hypothetical protein